MDQLNRCHELIAALANGGDGHPWFTYIKREEYVCAICHRYLYHGLRTGHKDNCVALEIDALAKEINVAKEESKLLARLEELKSRRITEPNPVDVEIEACIRKHSSLLKKCGEFITSSDYVTVSNKLISINFCPVIEFDVRKMLFIGRDIGSYYVDKELVKLFSNSDLGGPEEIDLRKLAKTSFGKDTKLQALLKKLDAIEAEYKALPKKEQDIIRYEISCCM